MGPPVPIEKNSADFAIDVIGLDTANMINAAEIVDIIFLMYPPFVNCNNLTMEKVQGQRESLQIFGPI